MTNQKVNNVKDVIIFLNANGINQFNDKSVRCQYQR